MKTLRIPIFKHTLVLADREHAEKFSGCQNLDNFDAVTYQQDGKIFVYFSGELRTNVVAHEAVHIANIIIENTGLFYSSKEDEILAYLVGYLTEELMIL